MAYIQDVQTGVQVQPDATALETFIYLSQNENGRKLYIKMLGIDSIPSGSVATISGTKPDGRVYSATGSISDITVIFNETTQMTAVAGLWDAKIRITNAGNTIASAKVRFVVEPDVVASGSIPSDSVLDGIVAECQAYAEDARSSAYGSPLTASTASAMTDKTRVYVYTGEETGYTAGHWYYWNGSAWTDGGVYNAVAVQTDKTLTVSDKAADAKVVGDRLATKADAMGTSDGLTSGTAKQLLSDISTSNTQPYLYRPTPADSDRERVKRIEGLSVGWNQLCNASSVTVTSGHKYYMKKASVESIGASDGTALTGLTADSDMVIDLTILFGSTIADHIYSLEQATAGSGVAWVKQYIDLDSYHEYSAPTIKSVEGLTSHDTVGFNQFNVENYDYIDNAYFEYSTPTITVGSGRRVVYIPCLPNTQYSASKDALMTNERFAIGYTTEEPAIGTHVFGAVSADNVQTIGNRMVITTTTGANAKYLVVWAYWSSFAEALNRLSINLSDPSRNGTYEPYEKHSYPLDSTITLRGIPKLVDGKLVADGDWYEPNGDVTVRYGEDSFDGSETWEIVASGSRTAFKATLSKNKVSGGAADIFVNSIDVSDSSENSSGFESVITCRSTVYGSKNFYVFMPTSVATTVEQMKAWVAQHPITVVYPLATPTTSTASPYAEVEICDGNGTEEFVTDSVVPVGNVTEYTADLKKQVENIYGIPKPPTTAGSYHLNLTVADGVPSYSWVSDS